MSESKGEGRAYYNEIDRDAAHVLRCLIADGLIAPGDVDDRSIKDVQPDDLDGYTQCHFFAGAGLWSVAARLAGWPDERPLWTGSCPCQPFSAAGRGLGTDDPRHLWPDFFRLIRAKRPPVVMGEQVAGAPGYGWFDGVRADLAGEDFASRVVDIPVCAVDGPHIRQRLYWITVANGSSLDGRAGLRIADAAGYGIGQPADRHRESAMGDTERRRRYGSGLSDGAGQEILVAAGADGRTLVRPENDLAIAECGGREGRHSEGCGSGAAYASDRGHGRNGSAWAGADWLVCHGGKARRTEPGIRLLVDGMAGRVPAWRLAGNSISPVLAAEVIGAFLDAEALDLRLNGRAAA